MTLNFYISCLVPVSPERIQKTEQEISRVEMTFANAMALDPSVDRKDADLALTRLRAQMEPERRREPAILRWTVGNDIRIVSWDCPKCKPLGHSVISHELATVIDGKVSMIPACPGCGAEVHKEELPMPLALYRMRTRRNDGVEIQSKTKEVNK